jgi:hypothetical protein
MAANESPGALAGATGAGGRHANAADCPTIASHDGRGNALAHHLAPFAASLDPALLAALGLAGARMWGGAGMAALRIARLRARFGLTAAQAELLAGLAWGAAGDD